MILVKTGDSTLVLLHTVKICLRHFSGVHKVKGSEVKRTTYICGVQLLCLGVLTSSNLGTQWSTSCRRDPFTDLRVTCDVTFLYSKKTQLLIILKPQQTTVSYRIGED